MKYKFSIRKVRRFFSKNKKSFQRFSAILFFLIVPILIIWVCYFKYPCYEKQRTEKETLSSIPNNWKFENKVIDKLNLSYLSVLDKDFVIKQKNGTVYLFFTEESHGDHNHDKKYLVFFPTEIQNNCVVPNVYFQDVTKCFDSRLSPVIRYNDKEIFVENHLTYFENWWTGYLPILIYIILYLFIYIKYIRNKILQIDNKFCDFLSDWVLL